MKRNKETEKTGIGREEQKQVRNQIIEMTDNMIRRSEGKRRKREKGGVEERR